MVAKYYILARYTLTITLLTSCLPVLAQIPMAEEESGGPDIVLSPEFEFGSPAWEKETYYNASGLRATIMEAGQPREKLMMFLHAGHGEPSITPWDWCWGDTVVQFETEWTNEDIRKPHFDLIARVSPCTCSDVDCYSQGNDPTLCECSAEDRLAYGMGSVLQDPRDGNFYVFLDKANITVNILNGDFKEIIVGRSSDGRSWDFPPTLNPLLKQSQICESPGNCKVLSFIDMTLVYDGGTWWGFVNWTDSLLTKPGLVRVRPMLLNSQIMDLQVEMLVNGEWRAAAADGTIDFVPDVFPTAEQAKLTNVKIKSLTRLEGNLFQASYNLLSSESVKGCTSDGVQASNLGSELGYYFINWTGDEAVAAGERVRLESRVRDNPSANQTGRRDPFLLIDDLGRKLLFSTSSDRICESSSAWPPGGNTFVANEIVLTWLSSNVAEESFSNDSDRFTERDPLEPLDGVEIENGNFEWSSTAGLAFGEGFVFNDSAVKDQVATIPLDLGSYLDRRYVFVRADLDLRDTEWSAVGLTSQPRSGFSSNGQVWLIIRSDSGWSIWANGATSRLASGTAGQFNDSGFNKVEFAYDMETTRVSAMIEGAMISPFLDLPPGFVPAISHVGFQIRNISDVGAVNDAKVDNFSVEISQDWKIFEDGFDSGDISRWAVTFE